MGRRAQRRLAVARVSSLVGILAVAVGPAAANVPTVATETAELNGPVPSIVPVLAAVPSALSCSGVAMLAPGSGDGRGSSVGAPVTEPSDYYAIELVPTGRVPGTRLSRGVAYSTAALSPFFGVALAPTGEYVHDLDIRVERLKASAVGAYVAWVTDTEISEVIRLGALDENFRVNGQATWNKFLVVITREPTAEPTDTWEGPIIMRGMSRSGRMHTLAGHGPFQAEPCAKYGFQ